MSSVLERMDVSNGQSLQPFCSVPILRADLAVRPQREAERSGHLPTDHHTEVSWGKTGRNIYRAHCTHCQIYGREV